MFSQSAKKLRKSCSTALVDLAIRAVNTVKDVATSATGKVFGLLSMFPFAKAYTWVESLANQNKYQFMGIDSDHLMQLSNANNCPLALTSPCRSVQNNLLVRCFIPDGGEGFYSVNYQIASCTGNSNVLDLGFECIKTALSRGDQCTDNSDPSWTSHVVFGLTGGLILITGGLAVYLYVKWRQAQAQQNNLNNALLPVNEIKVQQTELEEKKQSTIRYVPIFFQPPEDSSDEKKNNLSCEQLENSNELKR